MENKGDLIKRLEAAESALAFYAHPANYCRMFIPELSFNHPDTFAQVIRDDGEIARAALGLTKLEAFEKLGDQPITPPATPTAR